MFCFDGDELVCIATPEQAYHPLDVAGAKEGQRRNTYLRRHITERRSHCALLSLTEETARHIGHMPDAPEAPIAATVNVEALERMAVLEDETRAALADAAGQAEPTRELSQWGQHDADNPHVAGVRFLEDDE